LGGDKETEEVQTQQSEMNIDEEEQQLEQTETNEID